MIEGQENLPDLPINWAWSSLPLLAAAKPNALKAGPFGSALKKSFYVASGYKVYGQEQVISGNPFLGNYYVNVEKFESLKTCAVEPGDILVSLVGTIGKILILPEGIEPGIINPRLVKLSLDQKAAKSLYIKLYLESSTAKNYFSTFSHGGTMEILNLKILKALPIPLPPFDEQHRIVTKIKTLTTHSRKAREALDAIPTLLDQFRQSVLAAAFRGDLTADWREQNPDVEPAEKLLEQIKSPYPKPDSDTFNASTIYDLPSSWEWVPLGKLGRWLGGGTPSKANPDFWKGSIPWVSPKDMKVSRISNSIDHISELAISKSAAKKIPVGAILFVVRGMILNHTFPVAITEKEVAINQDMKALVPELKEMREYLLLTGFFIERYILFKIKAATHGTRRLETSVLQNWAVPVPPVQEQERIVSLVKSAFALVERAKESYSRAFDELDQLDQSILAKAFRGKLVPQDPTDEPATLLLQRIQAERENLKAKGKRKTKKRK